MPETKILELKNPRGHIASANIVLLSCGKVYLNATTTLWTQKAAVCNSVTAAKRLFSTHLLSPRHHGKNKWEMRASQ